MKLFLLVLASAFLLVSMKKTTTKRPKTTTKRTTTKRPSGTLRCFDCNSYEDNCGDFDESSTGSWETCSRSDYCIKQTMTNSEDGKKYSTHECAQKLWFGAENGGKYILSKLYALSSQTKFNSVFLKITIFQMITVTGKEMVVTRRRSRWMRTVIQSRTTRFAAATPTCKLHGSYSRRPVLTLHCSRCNSSGVAQVSVMALTAVLMAMLHYWCSLFISHIHNVKSRVGG